MTRIYLSHSLILRTFIVTAAVLSAWSSGAVEAAEFLADRHGARGVACASCHPEKPTPTVDMSLCLGCHGGSYAALAEKTADTESGINPHDTHLGEAQCTSCHRGHKLPVLSCDNCHEFADIRVP